MFGPNRGQADPRALFLARGPGYSFFLTAEGEVISLQESGPDGGRAAIGGAGSGHKSYSTAARFRFEGMNGPARISGLDELPGRTNYFRGRDPARWRTGIPNYKRIRYNSVYPGIDVVYYGTERQIEQDFVVLPGGDPERIAFRVDGAERISVSAEGDLHVALGGGEFRLRRPVLYQMSSAGSGQAGRARVEGGFVARGRNLVSFRIGPYDRSKTLVIDPVLDYSTFLGGTGAETGFAIAVNSVGEAYLTGTTASLDFPSTSGSYQSTCKPSTVPGTCSGDAFITKLSADGTTELFSTYLGGSGSDSGLAIALDGSGNAYVTGQTSSLDFPVSQFANQTTFAPGCTVTANCVNAFVTKISADGSQLLYSTYLGGNNVDSGNGIAVDSSGNAYVVGQTASTNFPVTAAALQSKCGTDGKCNASGGASMPDAFVSELNPGASSVPSSLTYSTYLGGSGIDFGLGIALDSATSPSIYITGSTQSTDFPVTAATAFQASCKLDAAKVCQAEPFVAKLSPATSGFTLAYSTHLGGSGGGSALKFTDGGNAIAVDSSGNAYITGETASTDFPVTSRAFQAKCGTDGLCNPVSGVATADAFVAKLDPTASRAASLLYSTYLGGNGFDVGTSIAVGPDDVVYVTGGTDSTDFPTANPAPSGATSAGGRDVFVAALDSVGSGLVFSTYLGGGKNDQGHGIAVNSSGDAYVTGSTLSTNFPALTSAFQPANHGNQDAFATLVGGTTAPFVFFSSPSPIALGRVPLGSSGSPQALTVSNTGDASLTISTVKIGGTNPGDFSETDNCASTNVAPGGSCTANITFTPAAAGARSATLTLTDSALNSPQTMALNGTGLMPDFSLSVSPTSNTVTAGQKATYTLTVTPLNGFNHQVSLTCSEPPTLTDSNCALSQASVTPADGITPVQVSVTVATTAPGGMFPRPKLPQLPPISGPVFWLGGLTAALFALRLRRRCKPAPLLALTAFVVLLWVSCGLGSSSSGPPPSPGTGRGTFVLSLNATSTSLAHSITINLVVQ